MFISKSIAGSILQKQETRIGHEEMRSESEIGELEDFKGLIESFFRNFDGIVSATEVGTNQSFRKPVRYNDFDVVIILKKLTKSKKASLTSALEKLTKHYTTPTIDFVLEDKLGPIIRETEKEKIVVLHLLLFDLESYKKFYEINQLTPSSWQIYSPQIGESLRKILPLPKVTKRDVLYSKSGIYNYVDLLKRGKMAYLTLNWDGSSYKFVPKTKKLDRKNAAEFSIHAMLKSTANVLRLFEEIEVADEDKVVEEFRKRFSTLESSGEPAFALQEKIRIRTGRVSYSQEEAKRIRQMALCFLMDLAKLVEELPVS